MGVNAPLVGLLLSGGGARAAYQVGFVRALARHSPEPSPPLIITGVSAGAINAAFLASRPGDLADKVERLVALWSELETEDVFDVDSVA